MNFQDVTQDLAHQSNVKLLKRFNNMIATNPRYSNLSESNQKMILDLLKKYKEIIKKGLKPSRTMIQDDKYHLYQNRVKLGLSEVDLDQINDLLSSFKE